jgi:hypothetical protein
MTTKEKIAWLMKEAKCNAATAVNYLGGTEHNDEEMAFFNIKKSQYIKALKKPPIDITQEEIDEASDKAFNDLVDAEKPDDKAAVNS